MTALIRGIEMSKTITRKLETYYDFGELFTRKFTFSIDGEFITIANNSNIITIRLCELNIILRELQKDDWK